jgi:uncharacterized protein (TIGR02588 family)
VKKTNHKVPFWEWLVAATGLVLILFVLGALVREAISGSKTPPVIELRIKETVSRGTGELVLIEAHNRGGQVASDLKVRGSIGNNSNVFEVREVTIDYLPRHSSKIIGLFFSQPTARHDLRLEAVGFVEP